MPSSKQQASEWISITQGAKLLGISPPIFRRYTRRNLFAKLTLPGLPAKFSRADVLAFKTNHIESPAQAEAVAS